MYELYKLVDGEWWHYGTWDDVKGLVAAANSFGLDGFLTMVEVVG